jgi:hypothetical protein
MSERKLFGLVAAFLLLAAAGAGWAFFAYQSARQKLDSAPAPVPRVEPPDPGPAPPAPEVAPMPHEPLRDDPPRQHLPDLVPPKEPEKDPSGSIPLLTDEIRKRLLGDAKAPESAAARTLRWTLMFQMNDTKDYINQLAACGATLIIPDGIGGTKYRVYDDLTKPGEGKLVDRDFLKGRVMYFDDRRESVARVAGVMGWTTAPNWFAAAFPKEFEEELAKKEADHLNGTGRKLADVETFFRITVRGGKYEIKVVEQRPKKQP